MSPRAARMNAPTNIETYKIIPAKIIPPAIANIFAPYHLLT